MQNHTSPQNKRLSIRVSGRVQGVGYRYFACEKAQHYGISGWVRNCDNGDVELEAQSSGEILDLFCAALHKGPRGGHVDKLETREIPPAEESSFQIRF